MYKLLSRPQLRLFLIALSILSAVPVRAQDPAGVLSHRDLFEETSLSEAGLPFHVADRLQRIKNTQTTASSRIVRVSGARDIIRFRLLKLQLDPGRPYFFRNTYTEVNEPGTFSWHGVLESSVRGEEGDVIIVQRDGAVAATIRVGEELYQLHDLGAPLHAMVRVDYTKLGAFEGDFGERSAPADSITGDSAQTLEGAAQMHDGTAESYETAIAPRANATAACEVPVTVRALILYTAGATGAVSDIQMTIDLAISETNEAYRNSNIFNYRI